MIYAQHEDILRRSTGALIDALPRHIPPSMYRDFMAWALQNIRFQRLTQLAWLPLEFYGTQAQSPDFHRLSAHLLPLHNFLFYHTTLEALSAHLAAPDAKPRRELLQVFHQAMVKRIQGAPATGLLHPALPFVRGIHAPDYLPNGEDYALFAQAYNGTPSALDKDILPALVAIVESAIDAMTHAANPLFTQALTHRHQAHLTLLQDPAHTLTQRLNVRAEGLLVSPLLAYVIGGVVEVDEADSAKLAEALRLTARIVLLLREVGNALHLDDGDALLRTLHAHGLRLPSLPLLDRILDDIADEELNIALHDVPYVVGLPMTSSAAATFVHNLVTCRAIYADATMRLTVILDDITATSENALPADIIRRFIATHERLYLQAQKI